MAAVIQLTGDVIEVDQAAVERLVAEAASEPARRARYCLHPDSTASLHQMVICLMHDSEVSPHRHSGKYESFHIICGHLRVLIFSDCGEIVKRIDMNASDSRSALIYRSQPNIWHTAIAMTKHAIFHEITDGPFVPGQTEFPEWADAPAYKELLRREREA
jgi:cupin fold WbuC family metalloprotein